MDLMQILDEVYPIPEQSKQLLAQCFEQLDCRKGQLLFQTQKIGSSVYFLSQGLARAYTVQDGVEVTFWFGWEGSPLLSMKGYVSGEHSYEDLELLENAVLFRIDATQLKHLFTKDIHIANWGRVFAEKELLKAEERLISRQVKTAEMRYRELIAVYPDILLRAPLRHIASYLGVTPVTLSRIRANIS
ncbi:MAG TPA: hypothetical protein VL092_13260 [Chitinophagaceae bacterium]|nr:hypothetical protein [Chitinophagaceae bacterium]